MPPCTASGANRIGSVPGDHNPSDLHGEFQIRQNYRTGIGPSLRPVDFHDFSGLRPLRQEVWIQNHPAGGICTGAGVPFACCSGQGSGRPSCTADDPSGCLCAAGASTGSGIGVLAFGARVTGNVLIRVGQLSVQGLLAAGGFPTRDVLVAQNRLLDLAWNDRLSGSGGIAIVATDAPVSRVTVRDNRVDHTRDAGIRLASMRAALSQVEVGGNVVTASCSAQASCGGIFLETAAATSAITQVTIARNSIGASRSAGIRLEGPAADVHMIANATGGGNAGGPLAVSTRHGPVRYRRLASAPRSQLYPINPRPGR